MKKKYFVQLVFIFLFINIIHGYSQPSILSLKKLEKNFLKINDTLFVFKYETSNDLYNLFLSMQPNRDLDYSLLQVDSTNWRLLKYSNEPYAQYYHFHPSFLNYPVVNITFEGAIAFCEWLTNCYNIYSGRKYKKVEIRLPSSDEWDILFNYIASRDSVLQTNHISSIDSYKERHKFYNVLSNVKEMTSTKGLAKGGDWKNGVDLSKLDYYYNERSTPFIGFRFFIVIKEK